MKLMIGAIYALLVVTAALVVEGRTMSPFTEIAISRETTDPLNSSPVLSGAKRQDSPLGGGATVLGTYYIEDTGSSITFLPESRCQIYEDGLAVRACSFYNTPLLLSNTTAVPCQKKVCSSCNSGCILSAHYGDGSGLSAYARRVNVTLGNTTASSIIGLVYESSPKFRYDKGSSIDGLIGLGYADAFPTVLDGWLAESGANDAFAVQLGPKGGALSLGGYNPNYFKGQVLWTPMVGSSSWYETSLPVISVGNTLITYNRTVSGLKSIVDSGTTHLLVPTGVFNELVSAIQSHVASSPSPSPSFTAPWNASFFNSATCHTDVDLATLPPIHLTFERKVNRSELALGGKSWFTITMEPKRYLHKLRTSNGSACWSFGVRTGIENPLILGDTFMTSFYTIIDRQNRRIGLAYTNDDSNVVPTTEPITLVREPDLAKSWRLAPFVTTAMLISLSVVLA